MPKGYAGTSAGAKDRARASKNARDRVDRSRGSDRDDSKSLASKVKDSGYWDKKEAAAAQRGIDYSRPARTERDDNYWDRKEAYARGRDIDYTRPDYARDEGGIGSMFRNMVSGAGDLVRNPERIPGAAANWFVGDEDSAPGILNFTGVPGLGFAADWVGDKVGQKHAEVAGAIDAGKPGYWQEDFGGNTLSFHPGFFGETVMTGSAPPGMDGRISVADQRRMREGIDAGLSPEELDSMYREIKTTAARQSSDRYGGRTDTGTGGEKQESRQERALEKAVAGPQPIRQPTDFTGNALRYGIDYGEHLFFPPEYFRWEFD